MELERLSFNRIRVEQQIRSKYYAKLRIEEILSRLNIEKINIESELARGLNYAGFYTPEQTNRLRFLKNTKADELARRIERLQRDSNVLQAAIAELMVELNTIMRNNDSSSTDVGELASEPEAEPN